MLPGMILKLSSLVLILGLQIKSSRSNSSSSTDSFGTSEVFGVDKGSEMVQKKPRQFHLTQSPPREEYKKWARYTVHFTEWGTLSHINASGFPLSRVYSFSDGLEDNSTGIPYFYVSPYDTAIQSLLNYNNRTSFTVSLASTDFCYARGYDAESPRCAQVTIIGTLVMVDKSIYPKEFDWARKSIFARHPVMGDWPSTDDWKIVKIVIDQAVVTNDVGGAKYIYPREYFNFRILSGNVI